MSNLKIKLHTGEIGELLKSEAVSEMIRGYGETVNANAGGDFSVTVQTGKYRAICRVSADTSQAKRKVYKNNALLKALHG